MQKLKILNSKEVKNIRKILKEQFGYDEKSNLVFTLNNKEKLYVVNRDIERLDIDKLRIDLIGMYFAKQEPKGIRLSIEGSQMIGPKATKNLLELNDNQFEDWLKGKDFDIDQKDGFYLIKYDGLFVGCGKVRGGYLMNYVPKSRRLIVVNN